MKNQGNQEHVLDCDSVEGFFDNLTGKREMDLAAALGLYDFGVESSLDPETAILDRLEPETEGEYVPGPRYRKVMQHACRVLGLGLLAPRCRLIEEVVPRECTPDVVVKPQARVILDSGPVAAEDFHMGMLPTRTVVPMARPVIAPEKKVRKCSHPGCRTEFLVLSSAPNADMCQKHHGERVRARKEAERARQAAEKAREARVIAAVDAEQQRKAEERTIRNAVLSPDGLLPEGASYISGATAGRQVVVTWKGRSFTVYRPSDRQQGRQFGQRPRHGYRMTA